MPHLHLRQLHLVLRCYFTSLGIHQDRGFPLVTDLTNKLVLMGVVGLEVIFAVEVQSLRTIAPIVGNITVTVKVDIVNNFVGPFVVIASEY